MKTEQIVLALREEASKSQIANDVFTMWAVRERSRNQVTLGALWQRMIKEGFKHAPQDYVPVLRLLAKLGLGTLHTAGKGKVVALKGVTRTLKSIGEAALGHKGNLQMLRIRNRYQDLPAPVTALRPLPKPLEKAKQEFHGAPVALTVQINGKSIVVPIPREMSAEDVGALVTRFQVK